MKMTIKEVIKELELTSSYLKNIGVFDNPANKKCKYSLDVAIDTMRKYRKIEQILKSLDDGEINYPQMTYYLREVLEDGNDY